jgi:hypothetical protein
MSRISRKKFIDIIQYLLISYPTASPRLKVATRPEQEVSWKTVLRLWVDYDLRMHTAERASAYFKQSLAA